MPRVSTNDSDYKHPYLQDERYAIIATERLKSPLLGPKYRKLLNKQIEEARKRIEKKNI